MSPILILDKLAELSGGFKEIGNDGEALAKYSQDDVRCRWITNAEKSEIEDILHHNLNHLNDMWAIIDRLMSKGSGFYEFLDSWEGKRNQYQGDTTFWQ